VREWPPKQGSVGELGHSGGKYHPHGRGEGAVNRVCAVEGPDHPHGDHPHGGGEGAAVPDHGGAGITPTGTGAGSSRKVS